MKEQFTPGEWEADNYEINCSGSRVAECGYSGAEPDEQELANAHLIAAAPKMYRMLENAMCLLAENDKECKALSKEIRLLRAEARVEK